MQLLCNTGTKYETRVQNCVTPVQMGSDRLRNPTRANQERAVDKINRNKMAAAVRKVWREQKHILIQAKFSRIIGNNKYISQSTRNWKFGQHKSGLTKPLKATNRGFSYATVRNITKDDYKPELKARISAHTCTCITERG